MAKLSLDRAIDTTTRGIRLQAAALGTIFVPDEKLAVISADLQSSGYTIQSSDYDQAAAIVTHSTTISINDNSETLVVWDTEGTNGDDRGFHSTSSNTSRFTIPTGYDGIYMGIAHVSFPGNSVGRRQIAVYANGGTTALGAITVPAVVSNTIHLTTVWMAVLSATHYVEVKAYQNSSGAMNITPGRFTISRVQRI